MFPSRWFSLSLAGLMLVGLLTPGALSAVQAAGEAPAAILYEQMTSPASLQGVPSQNFEPQYDRYDATAADDFVVPTEGGVAAWEVYTVEVQGQYQFGAQTSVTSTTVLFYATNDNRPGNLVYSAVVAPIGDTSVGNLTLGLSTPARLATGGTYWVAVQANKNLNSGFWRWRERTVLAGQPGHWINPQAGLLDGSCPTWTVMALCGYTDQPDLLFRLQGNKTANAASPVLSSLSPSAAVNRDIHLVLEGANFASGTTVQWDATNLGPATYVNNSRLEIDVSASTLGSPGSTVTVKVTVPGPCASSCQSNGLTFVVMNKLFLPVIKR